MSRISYSCMDFAAFPWWRRCASVHAYVRRDVVSVCSCMTFDGRRAWCLSISSLCMAQSINNNNSTIDMLCSVSTERTYKFLQYTTLYLARNINFGAETEQHISMTIKQWMREQHAAHIKPFVLYVFGWSVNVSSLSLFASNFRTRQKCQQTETYGLVVLAVSNIGTDTLPKLILAIFRESIVFVQNTWQYQFLDVFLWTIVWTSVNWR